MGILKVMLFPPRGKSVYSYLGSREDIFNYFCVNNHI